MDIPVASSSALLGLALVMAPTVWAESPRRLTVDGLLKRDPVYVDGGRAVLYAARAKSPRLALMRLDLKTGETTRVHPESNLVEFCPTTSSGGVWAFQRMTGNDVCSLLVEDAMGRQTPIPTSKKTSMNAAISPNGRELVYNLSGQLFRREVAGGREQPLAHSNGRNDWPAWSPDGRRVVFASSREGDFDLYVVSREGGEARRLVGEAGLDFRPDWSPDGTKICFTSNRDLNYEVYVVNSDGANSRRLTRHAERDDYPAWHPDGKRLVYVSERNGRHDLYELTFRN